MSTAGAQFDVDEQLVDRLRQIFGRASGFEPFCDVPAYFDRHAVYHGISLMMSHHCYELDIHDRWRLQDGAFGRPVTDIHDGSPIDTTGASPGDPRDGVGAFSFASCLDGGDIDPKETDRAAGPDADDAKPIMRPINLNVRA